ncbi:efflux RND transporter periplasmic adaptor subunit [Cohnella sp. AR92]|uniref:efflux RND transporter periplasmic adaptor subunit n=1 Tax=Cohnella sp. AR92 TaxID=648716 RepID=UPI000F8D59EA|nr:efflux RND transporter periplasmic adaptor subunit [Cohnella sp. AR92]RUS48827.1 HlyD family efflux transporter periplasmic adaptor subunit [Cohnella sp. AR92]
MKNSKLVLINVIVIVLLIAAGGVAIYYYMQSVNYITTSNAKIDGQAVSVASPGSGTLTSWKGNVGETFSIGQQVGSVLTAEGSQSITAPSKGTVVQSSGVVNTNVAQGTVLARLYDLDSLWVSANISEKDISDVKLDQTVDVYVDAFSGTDLTGRVSQIGLATAGTFSLLPTSNTTTNYTKVTQVIPIAIQLDGYRGLSLAPGMSVKIRIHK